MTKWGAIEINYHFKGWQKLFRILMVAIKYFSTVYNWNTSYSKSMIVNPRCLPLTFYIEFCMQKLHVWNSHKLNRINTELKKFTIPKNLPIYYIKIFVTKVKIYIWFNSHQQKTYPTNKHKKWRNKRWNLRRIKFDLSKYLTIKKNTHTQTFMFFFYNIFITHIWFGECN